MFANPDGSWTSEEAPGPVRTRDKDGHWEDIDLTLEKVPGGYAPAHAIGGLELSDGGDKTFAAMRLDGKDLDWQWPDTLPAPTIEGNTATYADVVEGGDLVVTATASGFKHDIVLHAAPADPVAFKVPMVTGGPKVAEQQNGMLTVTTKAGDELVSAAPPLMYDATDPETGEAEHQAPVDTTVTQTATGAVVTLDPDEAFLNDPSTTYPVTIDPSYASTNPNDTWIYDTVPTAVHPNDATLYAGTPNGGTDRYRTFVNFNNGGWAGGIVSSAKLTLRNFDTGSSTCDGARVEVRRVAAAWSPGSVNWNNQPTTSTTSAVSITAARGLSACPAADVTWDVTGIVQAWANGSPNYGFRVAALDETKTASYRKYRSAGYAYSTSWPRLSVTYDQAPYTATQPTAAAVSTYSASNTSPFDTYTQDRTPTLTSTVSDPNGGNVRAYFQIATSPGGTPVATCTGGYVTSGQKSSCTLASNLTDNTTYYVRATASDGTLFTGKTSTITTATVWSTTSKLIVSSTAPATPAVSCPDPYTNGSWAETAPGGTITCTVTATGTGPSAPGFIDVSVDNGTTQRVHIAQSADPAVAKTTVSVPGTNGGHAVRAYSESPSGVKSPTNDYGLGFGNIDLSAPAAGQVDTTTDTIAIDASGPPSAGGAGIPNVTMKWRVAGSGSDENTGWNDDTNTGLTVTNTAAGGVHVTGAWDSRHAVSDTKSDPNGTPIDVDLDRPVLLDIQVCVDYPGTDTYAHCTWASGIRQVLRVAHAFGGAFPVTDVPGGQVALWTGELAIGDSDATVGAPGADLSISRTASSFAGPIPNPANQVFGPGWAASLDGPEAGLGDMTLIDNTLTDGTLQLVDGVGDVMLFGKTANPARRTGTTTLPGGDWVALDEDTALSGTVLHVDNTGAQPVVTITEDDSTVTTYQTQTAATLTAGAVFTVKSINEAGTEGATTYSYDSAGRVTRMVAPAPAGVTCPATGTLPAGCRAMRINYATTTTATSATPGDVTGQISFIEQEVGGASGPNPVLATYKYDDAHRLVSVTDPRNSLTTSYGYDGTSDRVESVTPAGLKPIKYAYDDSSHRLVQVTRERPSTDAAGGTADLATIVYNIPTSGHTGLPDLTSSAVETWGQTTAPTHGAAVFGPDRPFTVDESGHTDEVSLATVDAAGSGGGTAWADADLTYTDADGRAINTADNGAGGWQYTSTSYDEHDNVIRSLDERDIAAIKDGDLVASQAGQVVVYNTEDKDASGNVILPAGSVVTDTYGTARWIRTQGAAGALAWVRPHTHTDYDQGAPHDGINPATGQRYALTTTTTADAVDGTVDTGTAGVVETYAKTSTDYSDAVAGDTDAGWNMGLPARVTTDMSGSAGSSTTDIVSRTAYDSTGRVIETRQPKSDGTDAGTRNTFYYTAGPHPDVAACGDKPAWAGALCRTSYAGSNPDLVTTTITAYDDALNPLTTTEAANGATRTTTSSYRADGAATGSSVTASGLSGSTAIGATTLGYDPDTGLPTTTTTAAAGGNPGGTITTGYDTWGRQISYTVVNGAAVEETTTTSYDAAGNVADVTDPKGTTSYSYDGADNGGKDAAGNDEHRGLPTKITVSRPSAPDVEITGAYDAAGALTMQKLPGGLIQRTSYDTAGEPIALTYSGTVTTYDPDTGEATGTDPDQPWLGWSQDNDALGRVRREWTPTGATFTGDTTGAAATGYARDYTYDKAARLVQVKDQTVTAAGAGVADPDNDLTALDAATVCQVRDYTFDANGNRTNLTRTTGAAGTGCPTDTTGAVTQSWGYDAGDRLTTAPGGSSYGYDAFGRVTTLPQADTPLASAGGSPGAVELGYYDDDSIESLTQAGTTTTFALDAAGRRSTTTTNPATGDPTTIERHYIDDSDNPGWTTTTTGTGAATVERYADDLSGALGLTITGTDVSVAVVDLHGDQVSQIDLPASGPATGIASWSDTDEYGNPLDTATIGKTPSNTAGASGGLGYGWLGGKQRATDTTGLVLMGARVYNPVTGSFSSTDPVYGGNTTSYAYPQDPINGFDFDGNQFISDSGGAGSGYTPKPPKKKEKRSLIGGIAHAVGQGGKAVVRHVSRHRGTYASIGAIGVCLGTSGLGCALSGVAAASISAQQRHHRVASRGFLVDLGIGSGLSLGSFGLGKGAQKLYESVGKSAGHWTLKKLTIGLGVSGMGYSGVRPKKKRRSTW